MLTPSIVRTLTNGEYHDHPSISKSGLDLIRRSPYHYFCEKLDDDPEKKRKKTKAMDVGTAFHLLALEPEKFHDCIAIDPDNWPTKKECGRTIDEQRQEFITDNPGKIILREGDMEHLREMARSIRDHAGARYLLQGKGMVEASMFWHETVYGVDCRIRPDWMRDDGLLIDIKTTENAAPEAFDRHFWNFRYHVQGAFYLDGYEVAQNKPSPGFIYIVVEKKPPYAVSLRVITPEYVEIGRRAYLEDIQTYAKCLQDNDWPGYGLEVREIHPPAWANNL
jgi:hypothetical protein